MRAGRGQGLVDDQKLIVIHNRAMQEEKDMKEIQRKHLDDEEHAQQEETERQRAEVCKIGEDRHAKKIYFLISSLICYSDRGVKEGAEVADIEQRGVGRGARSVRLETKPSKKLNAKLVSHLYPLPSPPLFYFCFCFYSFDSFFPLSMILFSLTHEELT